MLLRRPGEVGAVDQQVQRPVPRCGEGRDRSLVRQVEPDDGDVRIAGGGGDADRGALAGGQVADRERDGGARPGELAGGLGAER